jgi:hypothetical protein
MVCSALRGLFVYRTELKRPVDRYHPPCSLRLGDIARESVVYARTYRSNWVRADGCVRS